jgi:hypothetical protein
MVGAVAAVKRWMTMDHEERLAKAERQSQTIMAPLKGIRGVKTQLIDNILGHQPFGVRLDFDPKVCGLTGKEVVDRLKAGNPPIWTRVREGEDYILIHVFGLYEGQDKLVGERIAALFGR